MQYIGIDIHRKYSLVHVMEKDGDKMECRRLEHDDVLGVRDFFE